MGAPQLTFHLCTCQFYVSLYFSSLVVAFETFTADRIFGVEASRVRVNVPLRNVTSRCARLDCLVMFVRVGNKTPMLGRIQTLWALICY